MSSARTSNTSVLSVFLYYFIILSFLLFTFVNGLHNRLVQNSLALSVGHYTRLVFKCGSPHLNANANAQNDSNANANANAQHFNQIQMQMQVRNI